MEQPSTPQTLKFGPYTVDLTAGEIRKNGLRIRLQEKPLRVLALLAEKQGQVVTREELKKRLWPEDTFVDFETGLNTAVSKLRDALSDSAEKPRYIETIPRRGYRFLAPLEAVERRKSNLPFTAFKSVLSSQNEVPPAEPPTSTVSPAAGSSEELAGVALTGSGEYSSEQIVTPKSRRWKITEAVAAIALAALLALSSYLVYKNHGKLLPPSSVSIAVLPFANLTGDPAKDYLCNGVTEEMITSLARVQGGQLRVIARTSAMSYRSTNKPVKEIARELGVQYILEGSVQSEGDHLHVNAQLIRGDDQTHVWADTYDGDAGQILEFENRLTASVASALSLKLLAGQPAEQAPVNYLAHDAYLQGRYYLSQRSRSGFENALQSFGNAVAQDPHYARAYAGLAVTYNLMGQYNWMETGPARSQGKAAAMQAVAADPNLAEAHAALGFSKWFYEWDSAGAQKELQRAIELEPNNVDAHHWYAMVLMTSGRLNEADAQMRIALALDPKALVLRTNLGWVHYLQRQYPQAIDEIQSVIKDNPNFLTAHYKLWWAYSVTGDMPHAWEELKIVAESVGTPESVKRFEDVYAKQGYPATLIAMTGAENHGSTGNMVDNARCLSIAGDRPDALRFLERGLKNREGWMIFVESDPAFDSLRSEPEYAKLLEEMHSVSQQSH